jgi:hypothetical protein
MDDAQTMWSDQKEEQRREFVCFCFVLSFVRLFFTPYHKALTRTDEHFQVEQARKVENAARNLKSAQPAQTARPLWHVTWHSAS